MKKIYIWNSSRFTWRNGKYLADIIGDTVIMCGKSMNAKAKPNNESTKTVPTSFNGKNITCETKNVYILNFT